MRSAQAQVPAFFPLVRQLFEQHSLDAEQLWPADLHWQAGDPLQAKSAQSAWPLQLSSTPLPQTSAPSAQSSAQLAQLSPFEQVSSPQQKLPGAVGTVVHEKPLDVQRESEHVTGFEPPPSPQQ